MVCFSAYYYYSAKDYVKETLSEVTYMQRYAAMGTREEVVLPDGSKVWLNAGTLLVYPPVSYLNLAMFILREKVSLKFQR